MVKFYKKPKVLKEQNTNTCLPQVEESNNPGTDLNNKSLQRKTILI
jgi:hypothetical protein